jgi:hypothetical protein
MLSGMRPFFGYPTALVLYRFRYFDPVSKRWVKARYVAQRHEIAERYARWEIVGEPELRRLGGTGSFNPFRSASADGSKERAMDASAEIVEPEAIDGREAFLLRLFLRRYVTWCARARRYAAMEGAALLHQRIGAA